MSLPTQKYWNIRVMREHKMIIGIVSGGFDPIHSGHIDYIIEAASYCDKLYIGPNSDEWLCRKKGRAFMTWDERSYIIKNLDISVPKEVISYDDADGSASGLIHKVNDLNENCDLVFMNGGDRTTTNIPEEGMVLSGSNTLSFKFGIGGDHKKNSSSTILEDWKNQKTDTRWGYYKVLDDKGTFKTKELVIGKGKSLSNQKHYFRDEHWYVLSGSLCMVLEQEEEKKSIILEKHDTLIIDKGTWHLPINIGENDCHVIEIQHGEKCIESDIEKKFLT